MVISCGQATLESGVDEQYGTQWAVGGFLLVEGRYGSAGPDSSIIGRSPGQV